MFVLVVVSLGLAGLLLGGAWSLHQQGQPRSRIVVVLLLAALSLLAGILQLVGGRRA